MTLNSIPVTVKVPGIAGERGYKVQYTVLARNILHKTQRKVVTRESLINSGAIKPAN
jgi:hypothetical protein